MREHLLAGWMLTRHENPPPTRSTCHPCPGLEYDIHGGFLRVLFGGGVALGGARDRGKAGGAALRPLRRPVCPRQKPTLAPHSAAAVQDVDDSNFVDGALEGLLGSANSKRRVGAAGPWRRQVQRGRAAVGGGSAGGGTLGSAKARGRAHRRDDIRPHRICRALRPSARSIL